MNSHNLSIPFDTEAEQALLGSIIEDNDMMLDVSNIVTPESFYKPSHQHIFRAMLSLANLNQPIDAVILGDQLRSLNQLDEVGGYAYLAELVECVPSSGNVKYYAKIINEDSLLRDLISITSDIGRKARDPEQNVISLLIEAESKIQEIANNSSNDAVHIKDVLLKNFKRLEELSKNNDAVVGIPTGFIDLDKLTCGFMPGDLVIIAARPGMGKTALALNMSTYSAVSEEKKGAVYIISREMQNEKLSSRMLSSSGRVNSYFLKTGNSSNIEDWDKLAQATDRLSGTEIYMNEKVKNIDEIVYSCRSLHRKVGLKLVVVDYLQKVHGNKQYREQEISEISGKLKDLAKDLNIPVIVPTQLNRELEKRTNKRPILSDIRESGAIEQDADVILFIYREDEYKKDDDGYEPTGIAEINIAKNRDGPTGTIELGFQGKFTKFYNLT